VIRQEAGTLLEEVGVEGGRERKKMQVPDLRQPYPPSRPTLRTHRYTVMGLISHAYRAVHDPVQVKSKEDREHFELWARSANE